MLRFSRVWKRLVLIEIPLTVSRLCQKPLKRFWFRRPFPALLKQSVSETSPPSANDDALLRCQIVLPLPKGEGRGEGEVRVRFVRFRSNQDGAGCACSPCS